MTHLITATQPPATASRYRHVRELTEITGGAAVARGPDGPVHARRQPDQVAPGPHVVVLRDVPPRAAARPATARSTPPTPTSSTPTTRASGPGTRARGAGVVSRPGVAEVGQLPRPTSTTPWASCSSAHARARRALGPRRARPPPRAAAPGAAAHGHQARAVVQPARARLRHRAFDEPARPARRRHGSSTPAAWSRSGTPRTGLRVRQRVPPPRRAPGPFALADRPVTCGEWLAFIDDGGYDRPELWLSDGWATAQAEGLGAPRCTGPAVVDDWWRLHPGRPAARGPGRARLPRELLRGRRLRPLGRGPAAHRGRVGDGGRHAGRPRGTSSTRASCTPAPARRRHLFGDVWQWTSSAYSPYPGFRPAPGAVGEYNGKFMVNQYVLRGGCVRDPARTTSAPPTGTSSPRRHAGPSPASAWPATAEDRCPRPRPPWTST